MAEDELSFEIASESSPRSAKGFEVRDAEGALSGKSRPASGEIATPTLAQLYMRQGHFEQAARIWVQLLGQNPGDTFMLAQLAECQRKMAEQAAADGGSGKVVRILQGWHSNARRMQGLEPLTFAKPKSPAETRREKQVERLSGWLQNARRLQGTAG
ncbi:MAG: hypothetical protein AB1405_01710 [Bdellovibrionota bacterium]